MKNRLLGLLVVSLLILSGRRVAAHTETTFKQPGPFPVEVTKQEWQDGKRDRQVPVTIYSPKTGAGPFPVIIFSHGLGGTRDGYEYLGRHWASHGYVSVHLQHIGSDDSVWRRAESTDRMTSMRRAAANPTNSLNRPLDVSFAIDQIEKLNRESDVLKGRLDLKNVGVAGHSFGAYTTLAVAGEVFVGPLVDGKTFRDPRVKAAIPMSSPVPRDKSQLDKVFGSIRIPCLHMTGTKDTSVINETQPADRRIPYDHIQLADQYLITFKDGDHMIFSGRGRLTGGEKDARFQEFIRASSTAFWDAYLKGDAKAKAWLAEGGFEKALGQDGVFEKKLPKR
ncbi:MAG: acetylhydrolase [Verrucomicrobiae bacterium]|nr:acetylhydrolase [Verrucomicrobiae bacterium]